MWFGLTINLLKIHKLREVGPRKSVVTSFYSGYFEPKAFYKTYDIKKSDIFRTTDYFFVNFSLSIFYHM